MTRTATLTTGFQLFASVALSRARRAPVTAGASARALTPAQPTSIEQMLAGRAGGGLAMRWSADDAALRATWAGPQLAS